MIQCIGNLKVIVMLGLLQILHLIFEIGFLSYCEFEGQLLTDSLLNLCLNFQIEPFGYWEWESHL